MITTAKSKKWKPKSTLGLETQIMDIDAELAAEMVGFEEVDSDTETKLQVHRIRIEETGQTVWFTLKNNVSNRPFKAKVCLNYVSQLLKAIWSGLHNHAAKTGNGDSMSFDTKGHVVSAAHRLTAICLAEIARQSEEKRFKAEYGWKTPIYIKEAVVVTGVDPKAADTTDTGKSRGLDDVLSREDFFKDYKDSNGKPYSFSAKQKMSKQLATAVRLVWIRTRGKNIAAGEKLAHPDAVIFLKSHMDLIDTTVDIFELNEGFGKDGKKVSLTLSLGYVIGMCYLMAHSTTPADKFEPNSKGTKRSKAISFWRTYAKGLYEADHTIKNLQGIFTKNLASKKQKLSRDATCSIIVNAWLNFLEKDGKALTQSALQKGIEDLPRMGGIDIEPTVDGRTLSKDGKWEVGKKIWIQAEEPWQGEIVGFSDDGETAEVIEKLEDGSWSEEAYEAPVDYLSIKKPKPLESSEDEEEEYEDEEEEYEEVEEFDEEEYELVD